MAKTIIDGVEFDTELLSKKVVEAQLESFQVPYMETLTFLSYLPTTYSLIEADIKEATDELYSAEKDSDDKKIEAAKAKLKANEEQLAQNKKQEETALKNKAYYEKKIRAYKSLFSNVE